MPQHDSFRDLLDQLEHGNPEASRKIFRRFARRLIYLSRRRLNKVIRQKVDPEDVVQSVFRSFFTRQAEGQWDLQSWDHLWAILMVITLRKCGHRIEYFHAACRDVRREANPADSARQLHALDRQPTGEEAAMLVEMVEVLLRGQTVRDRRILELRLQHETFESIAAQVGCSENTVARVVERVRQRLERMDPRDETSAPE